MRPAKEAKETFSSLSPMEVWGAARWTRDIAAKVLEQHIDPHPAGTTYRLTDRETALRWMCKQYGQHLTSLAQDLGGWGCVGLTLQEIIAEQAKGPLERQQKGPRPAGNGGRSFGKRSLFPDRSRRRLFLGLGLFRCLSL